MYKPATMLGFLLVAGACGSDSGTVTPDAPQNPIDARPAAQIEDLPIDETKTLPGLSAAVEVVVDDRGAPHIYAANLNDAIRVQAYLMARDRFGQMEFFRRLTLGKLAEIFGAVQPSTIASDKESRFIGYNRSGADIYASLAPGDVSRQVAESFVAGVNVYIDEIQAASDKSPFVPPGAEALFLIFTSPKFTHWEPADVFALARFQTATFSFDPDVDIQRTKALAGIEAAFGTDDEHPLLRHSFVDLFTEIQGRRVYVMDSFPAKPTLGTGRRLMARPPLPSRASLDAAAAYFSAWRERRGFAGSEGSNNWVVSGSKSASGAPMLANDPHISLISPGVWWFSHLNTKRFGTPDGVNVSGVAFAALPGVVLGFNEDMAWGATVTGYDVTDIYDETVTEGTNATVRFNNTDVAIVPITETINVGGTDTQYVIDMVPHHGPIIPGTRTGGKALTVKYTGFDVSNELAYFLGLTSAKTVADAWAAQQAFQVGSQNFVTIARDGDIAWNTHSRIPKRDPRAITLDIATDGTITGVCPTFVLPGGGEYEWTGDLEDEFIPKLKNPDKGFIATANADNVGVTDDGNPCNDDHYVGGGFADGYRVARIVERLTDFTTRGNMTADEMAEVQAESQSSLGDTLRDPLVAILTAVVADAGAPFTAEEKTKLTAIKDRLAAWSRQTPSGVGATAAAEVSDSIATTLFAVGLTRIIPRAFKDEADAIGVQPSSDRAAILLERALTNPQMLATYDDAISDTVLWDNVSTPEVETKNEIVARGFLDALAFIETRLGTDPNGWRWGRLHTVRFSSVIPALGTDEISIPKPGDATYPDGFPRHADFGAVDVGNYSMWAPTNFNYTAGPSQRLVVEMLPTGPVARNALPGGQDINVNHPHHADEAQLWKDNQTKPVYFREVDVVQHAEARRRFVP